ncbi:hypothetical protein PJ944_002861 [Listeria monocytogenes]|nr:hypothetical protein [Listeria monocytogenes]MBV1610969.1 hypothetical protein [Listeria monocytogenes]HAA8599086.1 hypothetical protein [Listeria monocytogenes]
MSSEDLKTSILKRLGNICSTEELFDNLNEMNRDVWEYTCGIQVILDELSRREKQNKEEK